MPASAVPTLVSVYSEQEQVRRGGPLAASVFSTSNLPKGAGPNVKGVYGYTALHECAYMGTGRICQLLLDYKANVDAISKNGSTPLLVAAREGNVDIGTQDGF